jgi:hypothetical protein
MFIDTNDLTPKLQSIVAKNFYTFSFEMQTEYQSINNIPLNNYYNRNNHVI